jgi:uncharacterized membrane protein
MPEGHPDKWDVVTRPIQRGLTRVFIDSTFWSRYWHCHKLPNRSFHMNGRQFHVCARCTGIAVGSMLAPLLLLVVPRLSPSLQVIAPSVLVVDGLTQAVGLRESTNWLRFFTGLLTVGSIALWARDLVFSYG